VTDLLQPGDPEPVGVEMPHGSSPLVFVPDHAGRAVPRRLGDLGLDEAERARHIGRDIGVYGVTTALASALDAVYVFQPYSRLVIDCNRRPGSPGSIPAVSDGTRVPGNERLSTDQRRAGENAILRPYHYEIRRVLPTAAQPGCRRADLDAQLHAAPTCRSRPPALGDQRDCGPRLARRQHSDRAARGGDQSLRRPQPTPHGRRRAAPFRGERASLRRVDLRQDLIEDDAEQRQWARLLAMLEQP
jgi:predicted N-formylglutamate amidohydrolase